jgi:hypothetical protein
LCGQLPLKFALAPRLEIGITINLVYRELKAVGVSEWIIHPALAYPLSLECSEAGKPDNEPCSEESGGGGRSASKEEGA